MNSILARIPLYIFILLYSVSFPFLYSVAFNFRPLGFIGFHNQQYSWYISIYILCFSECLSVCLYPINVKTAEPIGPKFCVGPHVTPGKVYGWSNFQKFASIKIRFLKILKFHEFFFNKIRIIFCFCLSMYSNEKCLQIK